VGTDWQAAEQRLIARGMEPRHRDQPHPREGQESARPRGAQRDNRGWCIPAGFARVTSAWDLAMVSGECLVARRPQNLGSG